MRDQLFRFTQETAVGERARADSDLHALDQRFVFATDFVVELEQLPDPRLVDRRAEEVVEEPVGASGRRREERADRQVRLAGKDVDAGVRPDEVELAPPRSVARRPDLRRMQTTDLEAVRVRRHIDDLDAARVRDRAVVALEEDLRDTIRVRSEPRSRTLVEVTLI